MQSNCVGYDEEEEVINEEEEYDEPVEGDYITENFRSFWQYEYYNGIVLTVGDDDDWREKLMEHMDEEEYWPNVWNISDHGNLCLLSLSGEK